MINIEDIRRRAQLFDWGDDRPTRDEIIALCDEVKRLRAEATSAVDVLRQFAGCGCGLCNSLRVRADQIEAGLV